MTNYFIHAYNASEYKEENMKTIKLSDEELETMSHTDVAYMILKENGSKMTIQDLFKSVIELMHLPESYFESKIADFFGLLTTDKRFIMLEKGYWDLSDNHSKKVVIESDDEDEEVVADDDDDECLDEDDVNYDEAVVDDDDDDDDLKDLVIIDDVEEAEAM
ncbi:DNA-directed RNA polymerase subunit delta [bacterium]|nr:DNA-directed RNA polymerase subunit delta [bacterium]